MHCKPAPLVSLLIAEALAALLHVEQPLGNSVSCDGPGPFGCPCRHQNDILSCCNLTSAEQLSRSCDWPVNSSTTISELVIQDSPLLFVLDFQDLFMVDLSMVKEIRIVFTGLTELDICHSNDEGGTRHTHCSKLTRLWRLDLRHNKLRRLGAKNLPSLTDLYLKGNLWPCFGGGATGKSRRLRLPSSSVSSAVTEDLEWLLDRNVTVHDKDFTFCAKPSLRPGREWQQQYKSDPTTGFMVRKTLSHLNVSLFHYLSWYKKLKEDCPDHCSCYIIDIDMPIWVKVSCSHANLSHMPSSLPSNTQVLNVSYNKIESLEPIRSNPAYVHLKELTAAHNQIKSMEDLIGSRFIQNKPTTLNLQFNRLQVFNLEVIQPILERLVNYPSELCYFLFSGNSLNCNCETLQDVQIFIYKYRTFLKDADLLSCEDQDDLELISIDVPRFCEAQPSIDYMTIIISLEILLLVLVLSKLAYDVAQYRSTGELPCLARHICMGLSYDWFKDGWSGSREETDEESAGRGCCSMCRSCDKQQDAACQEVRSIQMGTSFSFQLQDLAFRPRRATESSKGSSRIVADNGGNNCLGMNHNEVKDSLSTTDPSLLRVEDHPNHCHPSSSSIDINEEP